MFFKVYIWWLLKHIDAFHRPRLRDTFNLHFLPILNIHCLTAFIRSAPHLNMTTFQPTTSFYIFLSFLIPPHSSNQPDFSGYQSPLFRNLMQMYYVSFSCWGRLSKESWDVIASNDSQQILWTTNRLVCWKIGLRKSRGNALVGRVVKT